MGGGGAEVGGALIPAEVFSFRTLSMGLCDGLTRHAAPLSRGRTAPIGCPRHSGVRPGL